MVDRGGLENRCGFAPTVGSNPTLSATCPGESVLPIRLRPDFCVVFGGYAGGAVNRPCGPKGAHPFFPGRYSPDLLTGLIWRGQFEIILAIVGIILVVTADAIDRPATPEQTFIHTPRPARANRWDVLIAFNPGANQKM